MTERLNAWLVQWKLRGEEQSLTPEMLLTMPAEAFRYHPELDEGTYSGLFRNERFWLGHFEVPSGTEIGFGVPDEGDDFWFDICLESVPIIHGQWYWELASFSTNTYQPLQRRIERAFPGTMSLEMAKRLFQLALDGEFD